MYKVIVTCEHGGNHIPPSYQSLFANAHPLLETHRGYDIGAIKVAKRVAQVYADEHFFCEDSRLLIDLNRSKNHPHLFSEITNPLPKHEKFEIIQHYYLPHRLKVENCIRKWISEKNQVLHLAIHSFTPELNGEVRKADIGLLFDPKREQEKMFCHIWQKNLKNTFPTFKVRRNYPYKGTSDGLTVYLRKLFPNPLYSGIEFEINQKWFFQRDEKIQLLLEQLIDSLKFLKTWGHI